MRVIRSWLQRATDVCNLVNQVERSARRGKAITVDVPGGMVVDDVGLLVGLACEGAGLAYVADDAVVAEVSSGRLERVLQSYLVPGPGLCLYFPTRTQTQPKLRALIEMVKRLREPQ